MNFPCGICVSLYWARFWEKLNKQFKKTGFPGFSRIKSNRSRSPLQFGIGPVPIRCDLTHFMTVFQKGAEETQKQQGKFITNACMHTCMHICMHAYMHACMHLCMHAYMHACMHAYMHAYMHACVRACMHACIHPSIHACIYPCMHASMHACIYACIFACIYACVYACK